MAIGWGFIGTGNYPNSRIAPAAALAKWQIEGFNKAISRDEDPRASGVDGLRSVQITDAMIESVRTKRTVRVEPILT